MAPKRKIFYNTLYPYYRELPYFIDTDNVQLCQALEDNWEIFRDEFLAYQKKGLTKNDSLRTGRGYFEPGLKTVTLLTNMYRYHERCRHFPRTMAILENFKDLTLVSINVLSTGGKLKTHYGETNACYRCHVGLIVPDHYPTCGIRVGNDERGWQTGKSMAFVDANPHKVWNHGKNERVVLIADVARPDIRNKWLVCGRAWASAIMVGIMVKWRFLKATPFWLAKLVNIAIGICFVIAIWLQRTLKFEYPFISRKLK